MSHPFRMQQESQIQKMDNSEVEAVNGGLTFAPVLPFPKDVTPKPPIYTTLAVGEEGGCFPKPEVM